METHIKVISWLYIILGGLGLLGAAILILLVAGGGLISGDQTAILVTTLVSVILGGAIILISVPGIIAGIGLLRYRPWARILALVLGILNLPGFPVGTILGIYTIWALLDDESAGLFESGA